VELVGTLAVWRRNWNDPMNVAVWARAYMEAVLTVANGRCLDRNGMTRAVA
jgi:hypothetical protein